MRPRRSTLQKVLLIVCANNQPVRPFSPVPNNVLTLLNDKFSDRYPEESIVSASRCFGFARCEALCIRSLRTSCPSTGMSANLRVMASSVPASKLPRKSPWRLRVSSIETLLKHVWTSSYEDGVYNRAAELAYFFFLSLFPGIIFVTTLLGFVFRSNVQLTGLLLHYLSATLPGSAFQLIRTVISEITRSSGSGKLTFGILAALWTANSGMNALEDALNAVYKVRESRPLWKTYGIALILTVLASLLIIAALTVFLYGGSLVQIASNAVGLKPVFYWSWKIAQWPIALFSVSLVASMVYYAAPNVKQRRWQWLSPGALFATLGWVAASGLLRLYFHLFTNYAKTYGSLGAVMVLLTWLYVTGTMLLLGAEVNMVIETAAVRANAVPPEDRPPATPSVVKPQGQTPR
jgi:membrane protein